MDHQGRDLSIRAGKLDDLTLNEILSTIRINAARIARAALGFAFLALLWGVLPPRSYSVTSSFRPQAAAVPLGQLSSLAAQFGVALPTSEGGESSDLYLEFLQARVLLERIAGTMFRTDSGVLIRLTEFLEIDESDSVLAREAVIDWLREEAITSSSDRITGTVSVTVSTSSAALSRDIAISVLSEVDRFNLESRRTRARAEAEFIQERLVEAESGLDEAEDKLRQFLVRNRRFSESPDLSFERERLQREVEMQQQVFTSLREALEQARIAAVRDTPVITVLQPPYLPPQPDSRLLLLKIVLGISVGAVIGTGFYLRRDLLGSLPEL